MEALAQSQGVLKMSTQELQKTEKKVQQEEVSKKRRPRPDDLLTAQSRLRSERVQEAVKKLRGWRVALNQGGIDRMRRFPNGRVAASYAAYVAQHATEWRQPVGIQVAGNRVTVELGALPGRRGEQMLSGKTILFAREIG